MDLENTLSSGKYAPGDIMGLYDRKAITGQQCRELLEDYILSRDDSLFSNINGQYSLYLQGAITLREYCNELYTLGTIMDREQHELKKSA